MSDTNFIKLKRTASYLAYNFDRIMIAILLGGMTLVTFTNVILRYMFNSSLIWGLELTLVLFAWLVLFGASYGFKVKTHLGVDVLINILSQKHKRIMALLSATICLLYAVMLAKGAWDYWAPFAGLQPTLGRWFPTGIAEGVRDKAFYITDQIPMLDMFKFLENAINFGDEYDKLPRVIPYVILPISMFMLVYRIFQILVKIYKNQTDGLIVSHEVEDKIEEKN